MAGDVAEVPELQLYKSLSILVYEVNMVASVR